LCANGDVGGTTFVANHDDCDDAAVDDVNPDEGGGGCSQGAPDSKEPTGCQCDTSGRPAPGAAGLLLLLLAGVGRRRDRASRPLEVRNKDVPGSVSADSVNSA
jgi:uncharacterized protein (TIGR03382 family)